jgi:uncharacterized protein YggU (UPF0235/DUF167 family)
LAEPDPGAAWRVEEGGVVLWLRLTPKGGRDAIEGLETLADGRCVLVAKTLEAPKSAVAIVAGHASRVKKLFISGDSARIIDALARRLAQTAK